MKYNVSKAWAVDDTTLYLEFDDGRRGTYDMSKIIGDSIFKKLSDPTVSISRREHHAFRAFRIGAHARSVSTLSPRP